MEGAKCNCGKQGSDGLMLRGGLDYTIPEGYEAKIEDGVVIVRRNDEGFKRAIGEIVEFIEWADMRGSVREDFHQRKRPLEWVNFLKNLEDPRVSVAREQACSFIEFLDKNSYAGKMCVSNPECEDIVNAFIEKDWAKLVAYADKYLRGAAEGRTAPLSSKCQEWIDAVECVAGAFPPGSKGYDMVIGSIHDLIKYLKSPCLENRMWSEDERNWRQIIEILLHGDTTAYDHEALAAWAEKQKEQQPAEWSEKDERVFKRLRYYLENERDSAITEFDAASFAEYVQWLEKRIKSLRPQLKREDWTDEDSLAIKLIQNALQIYVINHGISEERREKLARWLDIHCNAYPIPAKLYPHWEPTKEQMEALMLAIEGKCPPTSYMSRRLEDLYEGLANTFKIECKLENQTDKNES